MEIERKFTLTQTPPFPVLDRLEQWQGYLTTDPEVRIRRTLRHSTGEESFILCIKSRGTLVRHEVETPITAAQFAELTDLLDQPLIYKDQTVYSLPDGHLLECSRVDHGAFSYGEVEFATEEEALAWTPPPCLGTELTEQTAFKMSHYWAHREVAALLRQM